MTLKENFARWRQLTPEEKLRRRWEAIPQDVAQSMAFEGEPVPLEIIRDVFAKIHKPPTQSSPCYRPAADPTDC